MRDYLKFYIDGVWVDPATPKTLDVINPATEGVAGRISLGSAVDVDRAVKAARKAFATFSQTSREDRIALLERCIVEYQKRYSSRRGIGLPIKSPAKSLRRLRWAARWCSNLRKLRRFPHKSGPKSCMPQAFLPAYLIW